MTAIIRAVASASLILLAACEYSGHSLKAQMGRHIGETVAGTEYTVGAEVRFDAKKEGR